MMSRPQSVLVDRRRQRELEARGWILDGARSGYLNMCWMFPAPDEPEKGLRPISEAISAPALIKPIETEFDGNLYRSRTEARWAVFLTKLGVRFQYEAEGYDLDGVWYLPDFYVPEWRTFIEVKGVDPTHDERAKARALAIAAEHRVFIAIGPPKDRRGILYDASGSDWGDAAGAATILRCRRCPVFMVSADWGYCALAPCGGEDPNRCADRWPIVSVEVADAVIASSHERFKGGAPA